ncbi:MAG: folate family ECF transporter S component [Clostridia bacterium]|nr:folate family ECF transporter S component [Clostridia bacterium]
MQKISTLKKLALSAMLVAMQIILSRYVGIQSAFFQTSFGFVAIATASAVLGPLWGAACAFVADFLGVMLAGTGAYFPLFAINEIAYALLYGVFLHTPRRSPLRVVLCVIIQCVFVAIPLTPIWLYVYFKYVVGTPQAFSLIFTQKITVSLIEMPIKMAVLIPLSQYFFPRLERLLDKQKR